MWRLSRLLFFTPISSRACFSLPGNYLREAGPPLQILQCMMRTNTRVWTHPFQIQLWVSTDSQFLIQCDLAQEYLGHNLFITALNLCQITVSTAHYKTRAQRPGGKQKPMRAGELGSASKASCSQAWQVPQLVQYAECTQWMDRQTPVSYHVVLQYAGF